MTIQVLNDDSHTMGKYVGLTDKKDTNRHRRGWETLDIQISDINCLSRELRAIGVDKQLYYITRKSFKQIMKEINKNTETLNKLFFERR